VYSERYDTRARAMKREKEIMARKSRTYIEFPVDSLCVRYINHNVALTERSTGDSIPSRSENGVN